MRKVSAKSMKDDLRAEYDLTKLKGASGVSIISVRGEGRILCWSSLSWRRYFLTQLP
jgi:hypothetical protein